jgi:hypothetical protein
MNSALYGKQIKVPQELISLLKEKQKLGAGKSKEELSQTQGWKRNLDLVKKGMLTFQNLERIQNWFKTNPKEGLSFELLGGDKMRSWVTGILQSMREKDKKSSIIQKHTKPDTDLNPIVPNASDNTHQSHFKQLAPENINEEINRIKKLINYGSK